MLGANLGLRDWRLTRAFRLTLSRLCLHAGRMSPCPSHLCYGSAPPIQPQIALATHPAPSPIDSASYSQRRRPLPVANQSNSTVAAPAPASLDLAGLSGSAAAAPLSDQSCRHPEHLFGC